MKKNLKDTWKYWAQANDIPEEKLDEWIAFPERIYHCIFCGEHGTLEGIFTIDLFTPKEKASLKDLGITGRLITACPKCREIKGVEPCIPGSRLDNTSYCPWGIERDYAY